MFRPCTGTREMFTCGIWNLESRNSESRKLLNQESGLPRQGIWNPVSGIRHPLRGIKNPRLSWITLYGVSLLRSVEAPRGMARVIVEIQKRVLEPVRKGETRGGTR